MNNKKNNAIILLSGGLDSVVSLATLINEGIKIELALTFNYGQKSFAKEYQASKDIAQHYQIKHECITLDWLKNITHTSLVSGDKIPTLEENELDNTNSTIESMKNVWVPNRNGLFINIAAAYADALEIKYIIIGANKEEAQTFSDNSIEFITSTNNTLKTSTNYDISVIAPLIEFNKKEIVKKGVELNIPFEYINSCYNNNQKHCGNCESCLRLKRALQQGNYVELINKIFN